MALALGTAPHPRPCRHGVAGDCGLCSGERTRAAAAALGRPVKYQVRVELGWRWARSSGLVADRATHFVHPDHDSTECGRLLPRAVREPVTAGVAESACGQCWRSVLGDTPRRSR